MLFLLLSNFCYSQDMQYADSLSRAKADIVLSHFNGIRASKLLYSIDDAYFYVLLNEDSILKEYAIVVDSLGNISSMKELEILEKDKRLLKKSTPFDLAKYNTGYITESSNGVDFTFGQLGYFVIKDNNGKRFGEFHSIMPAKNSPVDLKLWGYIIRKLSVIVDI